MKVKWKLGFNTFWWENLDKLGKLRDCIKSLVEIGYDAVEFKLDSFGTEEPGKAVIRAAQEARKAGLIVSNLVILRGIGVPETCQKNVADVSNAIRICGEAGIEVLNMVTGGPARVPTCSPDEWWEMPQTRIHPHTWDTLVRSLEKLTKVADAEKVDLALEACIGNIVNDLGTMLALFRKYDHPRLMVTFDPSHYVLAGQDIGLAIRTLGNKIRHVHLKDAAGRVGEMGSGFIFPFPGEGMTDWHIFFEALKDINYNKVVSIEFEAFRFMEVVWERDPVQAARLSKTAADGLIKKYVK